MSVNSLDEYRVPEHVKEYLRRLGFVLPLDDHGALDSVVGRLDGGSRLPLKKGQIR